MKKNLLLVFATLFALCGSAQVINGDLDKDSKVTMNDAVLLVNDYVTNSPHYVDVESHSPYVSANSMIVGTWYETKTKTVTFNADGTTDYSSLGYTYKFLPVPGKILFYNASGVNVTVLDMIDCSSDKLTVSTRGSNTFKVYTKTPQVRPVASITLSSTTLELAPSESAKLTASVYPSDADNKNIIWTSSNENVAKVSNGTVLAVDNGIATITAVAQDGSGVKASCTVTVIYIHNNHVAVDLGTGVKWATTNIGADSPEDYGYYFAWGATLPQSVYDWVNCPYQTQNTTDWSSTKFTKYLGSTTSSYKDSSATDANAKKTVLDPEDDAAHVQWGGNWRMPTKAEQDALRSQCYWKWVTTYNGKSVKGYIVYKAKADADKGKYSTSYSPSASYTVSDPHIFLPAAAYRDDSGLGFAGSYGYYWSSSLNESFPNYAYYLYFSSSSVVWYYNDRSYGLSVRAVCP